MKKSLKTLPMLILSSTLILSACGNENNDDPAKINTSNHKEKKENDNKEKAKSHKENKVIDKDEIDKRDNKKVENNKEKLKIDEVIDEIDVLHDFNETGYEFYSDLTSDLSDKGIKLGGNYSSPYIDYANPEDQQQDRVMAGIIIDKKVDKKNDHEAKVTYIVRSARSIVATEEDEGETDPEQVTDNIKDIIKKDKNLNKKVEYKVEINKDKTKATVTKLTKGDWSKVKNK